MNDDVRDEDSLPISQIDYLRSLSQSVVPPIQTPSTSTSKEWMFGNEILQLNLPRRSPKITQDEIAEIAFKMISNLPIQGNTPAGYTYFGQMLTHDIVGGTTLNSTTRKDISPVLNLDSVYFDVTSTEWGKAIDEATGKFKFASANTSNSKSESDFFRDKNKKALIPDHRNDGNVIISQLHVLWLKLHNRLVEKHPANGKSPKEVYKATQRLVTALFQRVTVEDYLRRVTDYKVYSTYVENKMRTDYGLLKDPAGSTVFPHEFLLGVSRFNHSMVRERYSLNANQRPVGLFEIFNKHQLLRSENVIDWDLFFSEGDDKNKAAKIDFRIASGLISLDDQLLREYPAAQSEALKNLNAIHNLIKMDLNASLNLPSGKMILDMLKLSSQRHKMLVASGIHDIDGMYSRLNFDHTRLKGIPLSGGKKLDLDSAPFWLFILLEASLYPLTNDLSPRDLLRNHGFKAYEGVSGDKLGPIGSYILMENTLLSIRQNKTNIFSGWQDQKKYYGDFAHEYSMLAAEIPNLRMIDLINHYNLN